MNSTILFLLVITLVSFIVPFLVDKLGREYLVGLLPIFLLTGNILAESFTSIGFVITSFAIPVYAGTFLITDIISDRYGPDTAKRAVWLGFIGQIFFVVVLSIILAAPVFPDKLEGLKVTLGFMPRLIVASGIAYIVSQNLDVWIFHKIKDQTGNGKKYLRNLGSTIVSQFVDTSIFLGIAFYGRPPTETFKTWITFVISTWLVKVIVASIDTPFFYLATSNNDRKK